MLDITKNNGFHSKSCETTKPYSHYTIRQSKCIKEYELCTIARDEQTTFNARNHYVLSDRRRDAFSIHIVDIMDSFYYKSISKIVNMQFRMLPFSRLDLLQL